MLEQLREYEFHDNLDLFYDLSQDFTRSGYPTYRDGIKTRETFADHARRAFTRDGWAGLLFSLDGRVEGLIVFDCSEEERCIHTDIFNIRRDTGTALAEFVDWCRERWPDFTLDLGFPVENVDALSWLEGAGVPRIERSWNYQIFLDGCTPLPEDPAVRRVTAENFEEFAAIHRKIEGDMYWNCQRVRKTLDDWAIFVTGEGDAAGELLMTDRGDAHQEIFALEFADGAYREEPFRALLTAALNHLKARKAKHLTFFVDDGSECGRVLTGLGFRLVGGYVCHRLAL